MQREFEEAAQACELERSLFNQDVAAALHAVFEHKEQIHNTLAKTHAKVAEATTEVLATARVM